MASTDPKTDPPLHPVREGGGFLRAALAALGGLIFPHRHRRRPNGPLIDDDVATLSDTLEDAVERIAPFPTHD